MRCKRVIAGVTDGRVRQLKVRGVAHQSNASTATRKVDATQGDELCIHYFEVVFGIPVVPGAS